MHWMVSASLGHPACPTCCTCLRADPDSFHALFLLLHHCRTGKGHGAPLVNCIRCYNETSWAFFFIPLVKALMLTIVVTLATGGASNGVAAGTCLLHFVICIVVRPYICLSDNLRVLAMCITEVIIVVTASFAGTDHHVGAHVLPVCT